MGERKDEKAMKLDRKRNRDHGSGKKRCNKTHEMRKKKKRKKFTQKKQSITEHEM